MIDLSRLWVAEWVVCTFFGYLTLLAVRRILPVRHRVRVVAVAIVCTGLSLMHLPDATVPQAADCARVDSWHLFDSGLLAVRAVLSALDDGRRSSPNSHTQRHRVLDAGTTPRAGVLRVHVSAGVPVRAGQLRRAVLAGSSRGCRPLLDLTLDRRPA
jgi:hypothetical protein